MREARSIRVHEPAILSLGGADFVLDPAGAFFWVQESLLIVSDLHLEKGSSYAARGVFLPPYDTAATLLRLAALIALYAPRRVLALGDSFHDTGANARLAHVDRASLHDLQAGREWIWIAGNHDPTIPPDLGGDVLPELAIGAIIFRHEPRHGERGHEIAGHLHPAARVIGSGSRRRCFVSDGTRCVMPAFGAFAGGLNWRDAAFAPLFPADRFAHVMGRDRVYKVAPEQCWCD